MTLGDMYNLIEFITNKDFDGNIITPDRFNMLIKVVNIELFRNKYGIPEEYQPGRPVPTEYADITLKNTDDLKAFKVRLPNRTVTNGIMTFPTDYAHRDTIVYNFSKTINGAATSLPKPVEILREAEFAAREGNYTKRPTTTNPIGIIRSDGIHIRPITITGADFNYYRWPVDPDFVYAEYDGYITYDAAASTEFEFTIDEHFTIVKQILSLIGVNLREDSIVQYAETKLQQPSKKIQIVDTIIDFLASDSAGDSKGIYHPEIVKQHLNNVFNKAVYDSWLNGKRYSDFSQLDAWNRTYEVSLVSQIGTKAHGFLPFAPIQLPDAMGLRQVADHAAVSTVFAPMESTASVVFAELEVNTMDDTPIYSMEQNNLNTGAGESSHMLRFDKLPVAPATLITSVDVLLIVPIEVLDDYDDCVMPAGMEDNIIRQVVDLMSKKPTPDTSNDMVITKNQ